MTGVTTGLCQACGAQAQRLKVDLNRTIGALVVRFQARMNGNLCKGCIRRIYWKYTLTTLFLGAWAPLSLLLTPVFLVANTYHFVRSFRLSEGLPLPLPLPPQAEAAPPSAGPPSPPAAAA